MSSDNIGRDKLRSYADRINRLDDERIALVEDIKTVKAEASADGYNVKALNQAIKRARMTPEQRSEAEAMQMEFELYVSVLDGVEE